MQHFHNILYISQGIGDETDGLKQALSLGRNNKAKLSVLVIVPDLPKEMQEYKEKYNASIIENMQVSIQKTADTIKISKDEIELSIELKSYKTPATQIIQYTLQNGHDLIIKELETRDKIAGLKAIDMDLLRKCPCPVWLSRPISKPRQNIKIAVAVDPNNENEQGQILSKTLLNLARSLADDCSGTLHIVSCWQYEFEDYLQNNPWIKVPQTDIESAVYNARNDHFDALQTLVKQSNIKHEPDDISYLRGEPDDLIPKFVIDNDIDILVMGTVARTGLPGFIIGNTAENIVQKVPCSLMTLKPNGFVSPVKAYKA